MRTIYVSDLDGTLLHHDSKMSDQTIEMINTLLEQGMAFTLATARSLHSAQKIINDLHITLPMVVYNGAAIIDPIHGTYFYRCAFDQIDCEMLIDLLVKHHIYPFVYAWIDGVERVSYIEEYLHEGGWHYLSKRQLDPRFRKVSDVSDLLDGSIFYITCIHEKEMLEPAYQQLKAFTHTMTFQQELYRDEYWLELMPAGVSKAAAIQIIKEQLCFDRLISFGDAMNDQAMFELSDECYAVENAVESLKKIASGVIGSNDNDGVAQWLMKNIYKRGK